MRSSLGNAAASVRVEEYKRPTFEAYLLEPRKERPAQPAGGACAGEARYYFGLPVTTGKVALARDPAAGRALVVVVVAAGRHAQPVVASGDAHLGADGRFDVAFTPEADPRASRDVTWTYALSADVTDEGGETRSASRSFRLGLRRAWRRASATGRVPVGGPGRRAHRAPHRPRRHAAAGAGPPGACSRWCSRSGRCFPQSSRCPKRRTASRSGPRTPGDALRPRWETASTRREQVLRQWKDGSAAGERVRSPTTRRARRRWRCRRCQAGRLSAALRDEGRRSAPYVMTRGDRRRRERRGCRPSRCRGPAVERTSVSRGRDGPAPGDVRLAGQPMPLEIWRQRAAARGAPAAVAGRDSRGRRAAHRATTDRGGFGITLTARARPPAHARRRRVFVPWDDRALKVSFSTFRDTLRPGAEGDLARHRAQRDPQKEPRTRRSCWRTCTIARSISSRRTAAASATRRLPDRSGVRAGSR